MTRKQEASAYPDLKAIEMAPALLKIDHYIQHEMHRPSLKYEEVREDVKKSLREYLDKLTSIESELTALDGLLTAELAKPPASNTLTSRYIFTQKAQRLEDMLVHLLD